MAGENDERDIRVQNLLSDNELIKIGDSEVQLLKAGFRQFACGH